MFPVRAATPLPSWYGQRDTTRQGYEFTSGSLTPLPNIAENPYQVSMATVVLGSFSDGWQEPGNLPWPAVNDLNGINNDGAWDIGVAGAITVQCKVAANPPPPGMFYRIDFQVYVVAYRGITALPNFDSQGLMAEDLALTQSTVGPDPFFPGATWEGRKWTGSFNNVSTNVVSFGITAPTINITVVDTMEVFTRATLVPEPSVCGLWMMAVSALIWRRRRF